MVTLELPNWLFVLIAVLLFTGAVLNLVNTYLTLRLRKLEKQCQEAKERLNTTIKTDRWH